MRFFGFTGFVLALAAVLSLLGCASAPPVVAQLAAPIVLTPVPTLPPEAAQGPSAVYRNPRIGRIYLRAHEDANGRLLGPQVIYQIVEPGGWNVAALDQGEPRAADPRLREGPPSVLDPAAGWMLAPAPAADLTPNKATSETAQGTTAGEVSIHPTEVK